MIVIKCERKLCKAFCTCAARIKLAGKGIIVRECQYRSELGALLISPDGE